MMRCRRVLVGAVVTALSLGLTAGASSAGAGAGAVPQATPVVTPDSSTSPFTSTTAFCTKDTAKHTGLKATAPGVTADKISVVAIEPALRPGDSPQGFRFNLGDEVDMLKTFGKMINDCGGINGRQVDLNVIQAQGAGDAATTLANAQADCIKATEDYKAFIVISWTGFAAPQCVTDDHKTLMLSGLATSNQNLKTAQGRHILVGQTNEVAQYQAPMLDLIKSGRFKGKKVAVLYPAFTTGIDLIKANVIDLLKARGVNVVQAEALTPDPSGDISSQYPLVVGRLKTNGVDVVLTGSAGTTGNTFRFAAFTKELRNQSLDKSVTIYNLDAQYDAVVDLSRIVGGVDGAKLINDMNVFAYSPSQQGWRTGVPEGDLTTMCNKQYDAATTLNQDDLPQPAPPAFARDPYGTVGLICAIYRTMARAFYNAGVNLTQKRAIKAFEQLPYLDNFVLKGSPTPRPAQIINRVPTEVEYTQVMNKAEYPCAHPSLPSDPVNYRICLVPQPGYDKGGKQISGKFFVGKG